MNNKPRHYWSTRNNH